MNRLVAMIVFIVLAAQPAIAETCREKFVRLTKVGNGEVPARLKITTEMKKGGITKNEFWFVSSDHYMTIVPGAKPQWVLGYNNTLFFSTNQGKSWKKLRSMSTKKNKENTRRDQAENAKTVKNEVCGKEEIDGVMYDTVEADIRILQNVNTDYRNKYWIDPKTNLAVKAVYNSKSKKFGSITTQIIERDPDLKLPMPK